MGANHSLPRQAGKKVAWRKFNKMRQTNQYCQNKNINGNGNCYCFEQNVQILKINAIIEKKLTEVEECSAVLKYKTPHLRASATLEVPPVPSGETWQIGWIQACTHMEFVNTYGSEGCSSWEFPELTSGAYKMISDSDGKTFPWYGSRNELTTLEGPIQDYKVITVSMNDNFHPHVTWTVPYKTDMNGPPGLTHIHRQQSFYTWLVAKRVNTGQYFILKTIEWSLGLEIAVSPERPLGSRATVLTGADPGQPVILDNNILIPLYALTAPNANNAQMLIWKPTVGEWKIIVPPVKTRSSVANQTRDTACSA
ncbi:unnamed protein product [Owenia fusiformis]|uniref:Uncharacterized protein n=1 Tax=Owenia fusiformis TaxID=6347 RepID=A0A8J1Y1N4_OWEFU|nr:unnamed protein product [Owenia fusiformis]